MELTTPRLQLREFKESDLNDVYAYESDAEVVKYVAYGPYTKAECQCDLAFHIVQQVAEPRVYFHLALLLQGTERVIGWCGVEVSQPHRREAELGYALHRAYWGRGYITEAAEAIVDYSFTQLRLHRIFATCRPENVGSVRVMQKLGMQQDGYLHQHKWFNIFSSPFWRICKQDKDVTVHDALEIFHRHPLAIACIALSLLGGDGC